MSEHCEKCPNLCASRSQIVFPDQPKDGASFRVLVVGEAPGADEDRQGQGFVGMAGRTLHKLMESHGLFRGKDYGCANIVRCRPPENRRPTKTEMEQCFGNLMNTISTIQPKVVLAVGDSAARAFTGQVGLMKNIESLAHLHYSPRPLFDYGSILDMRWPYGEKLFVIPHTSPLAWNRKAPDGRKWSEIGVKQIRKMVRMLSEMETK